MSNMPRQLLKYHAFVSNANEDEGWVNHCLVKKLVDEWGLNVCTSQSFTPGKPIFSNIVEAMTNSTYIILVITRSFAKSQWCNFEMHMALSKDPTKVVMCYMQDIPNANMSKSLCFLLQTTNYVEWTTDKRGQEIFWKRLKSSLKENGD